jgi:hypothetical protein
MRWLAPVLLIGLCLLLVAEGLAALTPSMMILTASVCLAVAIWAGARQRALLGRVLVFMLVPVTAILLVASQRDLRIWEPTRRPGP